MRQPPSLYNPTGKLLQRIGCWVLLTLLVVFLLGAISCDKWVEITLLNKTDVAVEVNINEKTATGLRPGQELTVPISPVALPGTYPGGPTTPPPNYVIQAYEFVPGRGNIIGWVGENGERVIGGRGDLVYSMTYTWEELKKMNFTFTITRNVLPGKSPAGSSP